MNTKRWHRMRDDAQPARGSLCSENVAGWVTSDDDMVNCVGCLQLMRDREMVRAEGYTSNAEHYAKMADQTFEKASACYARASAYSERAIEILQQALAEANAAIPEEARHRA